MYIWIYWVVKASDKINGSADFYLRYVPASAEFSPHSMSGLIWFSFKIWSLQKEQNVLFFSYINILCVVISEFILISCHNLDDNKLS